jgi:hypothetical protein
LRPGAVQETERYAAEFARAGAQARLPLTDLALPVLRTRARLERENMVRNARALIDADRRVSLDEFVFQTLIEHDLLERNAKLEPIRYNDVHSVRASASLVAGLIAYAGAQSAAQERVREAERSYAHAETLHRWLDALPERAEINLANVRRALDDLRALAPLEKPNVIRAFVAVAQADEHIAARELALLRAIGSAMDCPIPCMDSQIEGEVRT